jgi:hypothetical protein
VPAQLAECPGVGGHHVLVADRDLAGRGLDQADQRADERGLAGAGEAHDDEDLAGPDVDRDVANGDDRAVLRTQLRARQLLVRRADHLVGVLAEQLPDTLGTEQRVAVAIRGSRGFRGLHGARAV